MRQKDTVAKKYSMKVVEFASDSLKMSMKGKFEVYLLLIWEKVDFHIINTCKPLVCVRARARAHVRVRRFLCKQVRKTFQKCACGCVRISLLRCGCPFLAKNNLLDFFSGKMSIFS